MVEDRAVPGHWEGDLICGSKNSYIATVVERQPRFTILVKVDGKTTEAVVSALAYQMSKLPNRLKQSLTWDRGTELTAHKKFSLATNMDVYFCDPSSPWQRGPMKILMVCCGNIFQKEVVCLTILNAI